jgi:hypothetical protein
MLAVTSLALCGDAGDQLLAVQARSRAQAAERRQKQAEALVDFMLGDLNDKLAEVRAWTSSKACTTRRWRTSSRCRNDVTDEALAQRARH